MFLFLTENDTNCNLAIDLRYFQQKHNFVSLVALIAKWLFKAVLIFTNEVSNR